MIAEMPQAELERIRAWTGRQLASDRALPWQTFLLTRLSETIDALLAGMAQVQSNDGEPAPLRRTLRLVVSNPAPPAPVEIGSIYKPSSTASHSGEALRSGRLTKALGAQPHA